MELRVAAVLALVGLWALEERSPRPHPPDAAFDSLGNRTAVFDADGNYLYCLNAELDDGTDRYRVTDDECAFALEGRSL